MGYLMIKTIFYTFWCVLCYYTVIIKAYRFKYNWISVKNPIISWKLRIFGSITRPIQLENNLLNMEIFFWEYTSICAIQNWNQIIRKWSKVATSWE